MADLRLALVIAGEDAGASALVGKVESGLAGLGKAADAPQSALGNLMGTFGQIGLAATGVRTIFDTVSGAIGGLIGPASEAQAISKQLDAVLESTGGKAGITRDQVTSLADALGKTTRFEDDAIISGQNMLLTFTSVGSDVFPRATESMLNMSQALGQDLKSSAIQLGKALNDPVAGATALRRVGVSLTDEQQELIKSFMDVGDIASAQKVILDELDVEFGNAAKSAGETFAGKLDILKNSFGNMIETIGGPVLDGLSALMDALTPLILVIGDELPGAIDSAITIIKQNMVPILATLATILITVVVPAFVTWATAAAAAATATIAALLPVIAPIAAIGAAVFLLNKAWNENWGDIQGKVEAVWRVVEPIFTDIRNQLALFWERVLPELQATWAAISTAVDTAMKAIDTVISTVMPPIVKFFEENWGTISKIVTTAIDAIKVAISVAFDITTGVVLATLRLFRGDWQGAWEAITAHFSNAWNTMLGFVRNIAPQIGGAARDLAGQLARNLVDGLSNLGRMLADAIGNAIRSIRIDAGPFHLSVGGFSIDAPRMPEIHLPTIPGFQTGGSFTVGGSGGADSQLVMFRASPGEQVRIGQGGAEAGAATEIHVHLSGPVYGGNVEDMFVAAFQQAKRRGRI